MRGLAAAVCGWKVHKGLQWGRLPRGAKSLDTEPNVRIEIVSKISYRTLSLEMKARNSAPPPPLPTSLS